MTVRRTVPRSLFVNSLRKQTAKTKQGKLCSSLWRADRIWVPSFFWGVTRRILAVGYPPFGTAYRATLNGNCVRSLGSWYGNDEFPQNTQHAFGGHTLSCTSGKHQVKKTKKSTNVCYWFFCSPWREGAYGPVYSSGLPRQQVCPDPILNRRNPHRFAVSFRNSPDLSQLSESCFEISSGFGFTFVTYDGKLAYRRCCLRSPGKILDVFNFTWRQMFSRKSLQEETAMNTYTYIYIYIPPSSPRGSTAVVGLGLLCEVPRPYSDTPHSVGLLWTSDQLVAQTST